MTMATIIEMPKLSDTMEEGGIASWLKKEGQEIAEGEALLEIETDKATMEYASPEEGILLKILLPAGKTAALNEPIAVVGLKGESFDLAALLAKRKKAPARAGHEALSRETADKPGSSTPPQEAASTGTGQSNARIKASPLARKIAKDRGLDISSLRGSGPNGRVVMKDVGSAPVGRSGDLSAPRISSDPVPSAPEDQIIPLSMMRKTIAKRLLAGKNEAPHFYLTVSANMEQVLGWRRDLNAAKGVAEGQLPKVSVNDIIIMAVSRALRMHPIVNSSWNGDSIIQHGKIHVCMAVALPTGLVTPALRNVDQLGLRQIAEQTKFFGEKARNGQLTNDDFKDGTFTVSNLGMTGIEEFTAIINPPQACILAVGKTMLQPWVSEKGDIIAQNRMKMTMSCDHRVVDGMVGAKFLETLVGFLESPLMMFS
jgi:pyruvate dehydrogenase E2 component (dihydrolipoamide acetyltransferase)